jgi:hypothetical protein
MILVRTSALARLRPTGSAVAILASALASGCGPHHNDEQLRTASITAQLKRAGLTQPAPCPITFKANGNVIASTGTGQPKSAPSASVDSSCPARIPVAASDLESRLVAAERGLQTPMTTGSLPPSAGRLPPPLKLRFAPDGTKLRASDFAALTLAVARVAERDDVRINSSIGRAGAGNAFDQAVAARSRLRGINALLPPHLLGSELFDPSLPDDTVLFEFVEMEPERPASL